MTWHAVLASLPLMARLGFAPNFQTVIGFGLGGASSFDLAPVASIARRSYRPRRPPLPIHSTSRANIVMSGADVRSSASDFR
ncbi:Uncharacterised protein [Pandoraea pulmonicola]|uniref:Uncharacterized protein n=1 Tax=Pandoraea pulmonicola TaxID=93221 RepID=A0AAJ4ZBM7_PANPU|nr:Uncharacterised protein [Pandoraea pulmonicola]